MVTVLMLAYLFVGLVVYALTDTRTVAGEIESRNPLVTFDDVNKFVTVVAIALWPLWLAYYFRRKK
ncbi:MAG TPA: hypothetical protein VI389_08910 [Geobacteraceae bacterium]